MLASSWQRVSRQGKKKTIPKRTCGATRSAQLVRWLAFSRNEHPSFCRYEFRKGHDNRERQVCPLGKLLYLRTIDGRSRWLPDNPIEITLEISENGAKRTETMRLENFEPKTVLLRENRGLGWRELLRLIPVYEPNQLPSAHVGG